MRNKYLTAAMERVLQGMRKEGYDGELVVEGGEVWYGLKRTNVATVNNLLRLCLIRDESGDGAMSDNTFRRYSLNEEGRAILNRPGYEPMIVRHIKKRQSR